MSEIEINTVRERLDDLQRELSAVTASHTGGRDCRAARVVVAEIKRCDRRLHELQARGPHDAAAKGSAFCGASCPACRRDRDRSNVASGCGVAPRGYARELVADLIDTPVAELDLGRVYEVRS